jgi:hypothetical protein
MEHACYKCSQMIEEGTPFCAHCGAPQIRVTVATPVALPAGDETHSEPNSAVARETSLPMVALPMLWSHAVRPCALAAVIAILLTLLGLNPFVTMLGAGVLAVVFYRYRNPLIAMRAGAGARLGALSGLIGSAILVVPVAIVVAMHKVAEIQDLMLKNLEQSGARYSGPQYQTALELFRSPNGLVLVMILTMMMFVILSSLGGALAGSFLAKRNPR